MIVLHGDIEQSLLFIDNDD